MEARTPSAYPNVPVFVAWMCDPLVAVWLFTAKLSPTAEVASTFRTPALVAAPLPTIDIAGDDAPEVRGVARSASVIEPSTIRAPSTELLAMFASATAPDASFALVTEPFARAGV